MPNELGSILTYFSKNKMMTTWRTHYMWINLSVLTCIRFKENGRNFLRHFHKKRICARVCALMKLMFRIYIKMPVLVFQGNGFVTISHLRDDLKWEQQRAHRALVCDISLSLLLSIT